MLTVTVFKDVKYQNLTWGWAMQD